MSQRPITNYQLPITKKLRICVVTGTRAEFGIWMPVLRAIRESKLLELKLVVTGMHLLKAFGETVKEIEQSGFEIAAHVPMYENEKSAASRPKSEVGAAAQSLARGIEGLAEAYRQVGADLVMVLGDRLEMLAAASAALAGRIPLAHVHGGETAPGIWDEQIRHALTKMAHVHFCATPTAGRRIVRMGEEPARVHVVGAPALDDAAHFVREYRDFARGRSYMNPPSIIGPKPLLLLHPSSADARLEYARARMAVRVLLRKFGRRNLLIVGPNNDPGHRGILRAYRELRLPVYMSLDRDKFWVALFVCGLLVGNSSSGIIEAATFGVPVVNLGDRQAGRERCGNVLDVGWEEGAAGIERALRRVLTDKAFARRVARRKNVYGDGKARGRIVKVLEKIAREGLPLEKRFVDG